MEEKNESLAKNQQARVLPAHAILAPPPFPEETATKLEKVYQAESRELGASRTGRRCMCSIRA